MEQNNSYTVANINEIGQNQNMNFILIEINKILFDPGMKKKVKELCNMRGFELGIKSAQNMEGFDLNKFDVVYKNINDNMPLDPVMIKQYKQTKYYTVIQGRHRIVASLYYGYNYVPAFIQ